MKRLSLAAVILAASVAAASAQTPPIDDVEAVESAELVVRGKLPGPAWWRVSDADTTVYVLGMPDALPKGQTWDQSVLQRRLKGANRVITPPEVRAGANPLAVPKLLIDMKKATGSKTALDAAATPEMRARLAAAAKRAGKTSAAYQSMKPWYAGLKLSEHYRKAVGLNYGEPYGAVRKAVKKSKVKAAPAMVVEMKAATLLKDLRSMPDAGGRACLEQAIEEVEAGDAVVRRAGQAWAVGDVKGALQMRRSSERCLAMIPGAGDFKRQAMTKQADAIEAALQQPGHAVAVLSIRSLVAREGVLEKLRARGHQIRTPAE